MKVLEEVNTNLGMSFKTVKEMKAHADAATAVLTTRWLESGKTDMTIYQDPEYIWDTISCYTAMSRACVQTMERYFRAFSVQKGKVLDVYNGCGLSTVALCLAGFDAEAMNTEPPQVEFMQRTARRVLGREIVVHQTLDLPKFDAVCSFECIEHYREPLLHAADLVHLTKPDGHIIESTGFLVTSYVGHFDTYIIDGREVPYRQAGMAVQRAFEAVGTKVCEGFQRKPRVWALGTPTTPETRWKRNSPGFRGFNNEMLAMGVPPNL